MQHFYMPLLFSCIKTSFWNKDLSEGTKHECHVDIFMLHRMLISLQLSLWAKYLIVHIHFPFILVLLFDDKT